MKLGKTKSGRGQQLVVAVALLFLWVATAGAETPTRTVQDETGRAVRVPDHIGRIVSLAPNLTEMVYALGVEERLVGITNQCDYPPEVKAKPRVGDVIQPSLETIVELRPDVVLGTTEGNRRETVEALEKLGIPLYGISTSTVPAVFSSLRHLAELVGVPARGEELAAELEARLAALEAELRSRHVKPRVLLVIWIDPLVTTGGGTFLDDLLTRGGAVSLTGGLSQKWPRLSLEEVTRADPDFLLLPRIESLEARWAEAREHEPWQSLRAVRENRVVWVDEGMIRPGPRIVEMMEALAAALGTSSVNARSLP
jgi:iron complex transport system substrate-binding protein